MMSEINKLNNKIDFIQKELSVKYDSPILKWFIDDIQEINSENKESILNKTKFILNEFKNWKIKINSLKPILNNLIENDIDNSNVSNLNRKLNLFVSNGPVATAITNINSNYIFFSICSNGRGSKR